MKKVMSYHLGLCCQAGNLRLALKVAFASVSEEKQKKLVIRSDNGPQISSWHFKAYVDAPLT